MRSSAGGRSTPPPHGCATAAAWLPTSERHCSRRRSLAGRPVRRRAAPPGPCRAEPAAGHNPPPRSGGLAPPSTSPRSQSARCSSLWWSPRCLHRHPVPFERRLPDCVRERHGGGTRGEVGEADAFLASNRPDELLLHPPFHFVVGSEDDWPVAGRRVVGEFDPPWRERDPHSPISAEEERRVLLEGS